MTEEVFTKWEVIVRQYYGKKFVAVAKRIWMDVWCVINGIKPAWLVDYLPLDESKLYHLLQESMLGGIFTLQEHSLAILTLNSDLFLINSSINLVNDASKLPKFVDISEKSGQPSIIANRVGESIGPTIQSIQAIVTASSSEKLFTVYLTVSSHVNLCSVFGWLLGYPIIYWFDSSAQSTIKQLVCYSACVSSSLVSLIYVVHQVRAQLNRTVHCLLMSSLLS